MRNRRAPRSSMRLWCLLPALLCGVTCDPVFKAQPADQGAKGYVGRVTGSEALIALLIEAEHVVAYVCDGVEGSGSIAGWFEGALIGGEFELVPIAGTSYEGRRATASIGGTVNEQGIEGTYDPGDGSAQSWSVSAAAGDRAAGLYLLSDGDDLISVVVDNHDALQGLSRSRTTGWTKSVTAAGALRPATTLSTQVREDTGPVLRQVPLMTKVPDIIRMIAPPPDSPPVAGLGTLMIHAVVARDKAAGHRGISAEPDELSVPTLELTDLFLNGKYERAALAANMKVRVLDELGKVISTHFIDDPLNGAIEAPDDPRTGAGLFWVQGDGRGVESFLVAVPNAKGARTVTFTRFTTTGVPINAGSIDLTSKPIARPLGKETRRALSVTGYDANDAEINYLQINGAPEDHADLLILAEGFADNNFDRNRFSDTVAQSLEDLWNIQAYQQVQSSINVYTAYVPSRYSGAAGSPNTIMDTPFQAYFGHNGIARLTWLTPDGLDFAYEVAALLPGNYGAGSIDTIGILINDTTYGGGGGQVLLWSLHPDAPEVFAHEVGHAMVKLADEYEDPYGPDPVLEQAAIANARTRANCSGAVSSRQELKWFPLVHPATSIPTQSNATCTLMQGCSPSTLPLGTAGMFEGAGYTPCDSFRPTTECIMRCKEAGFFCPVCTAAYQKTFGPYQPGAVDVYIRDHAYDYGATPSFMGVDPDGSGVRVWPWESPDIRVDAPPFHDGDPAHPHEAPIPGETNRVYVTVHNRGTGAPVDTSVAVWYSVASIGSPSFPDFAWLYVGGQDVAVPGNEGQVTLTFDWVLAAGSNPNQQLLVLLNAPADELDNGSLVGQNLNDVVRNHNNVARRNQYPISLPSMRGELTNYERQSVPAVLTLNFPRAPQGTTFTLVLNDPLILTAFDPVDIYAFSLVGMDTQKVEFQCTATGQEYLQLRLVLPEGSDQVPYSNPFALDIGIPAGAPIHGIYYVTFILRELVSDDIQGDTIGSGGYIIAFN